MSDWNTGCSTRGTLMSLTKQALFLYQNTHQKNSAYLTPDKRHQHYTRMDTEKRAPSWQTGWKAPTVYQDDRHQPNRQNDWHWHHTGTTCIDLADRTTGTDPTPRRQALTLYCDEYTQSKNGRPCCNKEVSNPQEYLEMKLTMLARFGKMQMRILQVVGGDVAVTGVLNPNYQYHMYWMKYCRLI